MCSYAMCMCMCMFMNIRTQVHVPGNLGICVAHSESGNCVPISRLRSESQDCVNVLRNLEIAPQDCVCRICKLYERFVF